MIQDLPQPPTLPGVTWRSAQRGDAAGIASLQDAVFEVDGGWREVESEILDRWESEYCVVKDDSLIGVNDNGDVIASIWSCVPSLAATKWRAFHDNYVHPDHRTHAIREFVLTWWEERCRQRFSTKDDGLPQSLWRDAYDWQTDKIEFLEAHGYEALRYFDELVVDLSQPIPEPSLPDGLTLESWVSAPLEDSRTAHNASFVDHWGSQPHSKQSWAEHVNEFHLPKASFVVYDGGEPVSYLLSAAFPHDFEDKGRKEAWIEGLGTVRSHRKRGIASTLVTMAMEKFKADGMDFAVLGVDSENASGAYHIYEALGFISDRRSVAYIKNVGMPDGVTRT